MIPTAILEAFKPNEEPDDAYSRDRHSERDGRRRRRQRPESEAALSAAGNQRPPGRRLLTAAGPGGLW